MNKIITGNIEKLALKLLISVVINIAAAFLAYFLLFSKDFSFLEKTADYPIRFRYAVSTQLLIIIYYAALRLHFKICKNVMPFSKKIFTVLYLFLCILLINPYIYYGIFFYGILGTSVPHIYAF